MAEAAQTVTEALLVGTREIVSAALGQPARISAMQRLTGGTSHDSWAFDAEVEGIIHPLILRRDFSSEILDLDLATEYDLLSRLHAAGLAVSKPLTSGDARSVIGAAYSISERLTGGDVRKRMARQERQPTAIGVALVELQARIHKLEWAAIVDGLLPQHGAGTALYQVERWAGVAMLHARGPDLLLAATVDWLKTNLPAETPLCLVHGDYKANNLVVGDDGRFAIIDWELAHIGDPLEDIAWTMLWRTPHDLVGGMLLPDQYIAAYENAVGVAVDQRRLDYWRLFVLMKLLAVFLKSNQLRGDRQYPRPTHVMLERAIPWLHRQMADRLIAATSREEGV